MFDGGFGGVQVLQEDFDFEGGTVGVRHGCWWCGVWRFITVPSN